MKTRKQLLDDFLELSYKLGKTPSKSDLKKHGFKLYCYYKCFGSLKNVSLLLGLSPNIKGSKKYSEEMLLDELKRLNAVLSKVPTYKDIVNNSYIPISVYYNYFSSFNSALEKAGLGIGLSKQEITDDILRIYNDLGKAPTTKEFDGYSETVCWHTASKILCGTTRWNDALKECGISKANNRNISVSDLKTEVVRLKSLIGSLPSQNEMNKLGKYSIRPYRRLFGTYCNALNELGFHDIPKAGWKNRKFAYGKDGNLYRSRFEANIANFLLHSGERFEYEKLVCSSRKWTCDFYILRLNLWLEADGMGNKRKNSYDENNEKINFYKENGYNFYVIKYHTNYIRVLNNLLKNERKIAKW